MSNQHEELDKWLIDHGLDSDHGLKIDLRAYINREIVRELEKFINDAHLYSHMNGDWEWEMKQRITKLKRLKLRSKQND